MTPRRAPRKPGRPATGKNRMIAIRWEPWLLDALDHYAANQCLERPIALRQIVTRFLIAYFELQEAKDES